MIIHVLEAQIHKLEEEMWQRVVVFEEMSNDAFAVLYDIRTLLMRSQLARAIEQKIRARPGTI